MNKMWRNNLQMRMGSAVRTTAIPAPNKRSSCIGLILPSRRSATEWTTDHQSPSKIFFSDRHGSLHILSRSRNLPPPATGHLLFNYFKLGFLDINDVSTWKTNKTRARVDRYRFFTTTHCRLTSLSPCRALFNNNWTSLYSNYSNLQFNNLQIWCRKNWIVSCVARRRHQSVSKLWQRWPQSCAWIQINNQMWDCGLFENVSKDRTPHGTAVV